MSRIFKKTNAEDMRDLKAIMRMHPQIDIEMRENAGRGEWTIRSKPYTEHSSLIYNDILFSHFTKDEYRIKEPS